MDVLWQWVVLLMEVRRSERLVVAEVVRWLDACEVSRLFLPDLVDAADEFAETGRSETIGEALADIEALLHR